jgi:hypothetical protein
LEIKNYNIAPALERFNKTLEYNMEITELFEIINIDNIFYAKNMHKKYRNVINNFRLTTNQPNNYKNTIYIFGNSITFGIGSEDSETIPSCLQRIINQHFKNNKEWCIMNCANHAG